MATRRRQRLHRIEFPWGEIRVKRSAFIDAGIFLYMFSWMVLAFGTIQAVGSSPWTVLGALVSGLVSLMYLAGQKVSYLRVGDRIEIQTKDDKRPRHERD